MELRYVVVRGRSDISLDDFTRRVSDMLEQGWALSGSLVTYRELKKEYAMLCQPLFKVGRTAAKRAEKKRAQSL
jgi:hypothetical protein